MNELQVAEKESKSFQLEISKIENTASSIVVNSQSSYESAVGMIKYIDSVSKKIDEKRKEITQPLDAAKKAVQAMFMPSIGICENASAAIRKVVASYTIEMERKRQEEQSKLEVKAQEEERKKKEALNKRIAEELAKGNDEKAAALEEKKENISIQAPIVAAKIQAPTGATTMKVWKYKVTDEFMVPRDYLVVNDELLSKLAKIQHDMVKVPGIEFYYETSMVIRK